MLEWWDSLGAIGRVFACVAIPSTVILFLQTILMLIGIGGSELGAESADADIDTDIDVDVEASDGVFGDGDTSVDSDFELDDGLRWFSFRGIIAFLTVTGWVGVLCVRMEMSMPLTVLIAAASGVAAMFAIALLFRLIYSLQADGTEDIRHALGMAGTVYLRIPPERSGRGKVNLMLDGKLVEKEAVTDEEDVINYGEQIVVVGISGQTELIVRRKRK